MSSKQKKAQTTDRTAEERGTSSVKTGSDDSAAPGPVIKTEGELEFFTTAEGVRSCRKVAT